MSWSARPPPRRPLPADVRRARKENERVNESNREILEPLIGAHLTAYAAALDELEGAHRLVADETTLELDTETRPAAMWLITGRCIGLARAAHLASAGYVFETVPVLRSLHEAARLLTLVTHRGEDDVVNRWLRGRHVSRGEIMAAIDRQEEAARVEMIQQGIAPPPYLEGQYGRWSEFAHHRRRHMLTQFSLPARIMVTGPNPDWRSRATMVDHYGWYLGELVSAGGSALGRLLGPAWFHDRFQPTFHALVELKTRIPLAAIASGGQAPPRPTP
jgi:hypothetical protein